MISSIASNIGIGSQQTFTCSKSTKETEKDVKIVQMLTMKVPERRQ